MIHLFSIYKYLCLYVIISPLIILHLKPRLYINVFLQILKMFPPVKEKCKEMVGIFELCNPHLLSEEILTDQLTSVFPLFSPSMTKAQALDLFCSHISPKEQRVHRDNRRGVLLKRLQRSSLKKVWGWL